MFHSGGTSVFEPTTAVDIPPSILSLLTIPNDITIRQGEGQLVPAEIKSDSGFSNDVTNITFSKGHNDIASAANRNGLHVSIQRIQGYGLSLHYLM